MKINLANLRRSYHNNGLREAEVFADPFEQFGRWFGDAKEAGGLEPNAMTLATTTPEGRPSARIVLLKGFDRDGFVFFTNYDSRKAQELAQNPWAALVFWWGELERQVRIEGAVTKVDAETSDAYFATRPRGSQLGAWASSQSRVVASREALEDELARLEARFADEDVPRPPHWGGYRLVPDAVEFWQGRPNRLHDRLRYYRSGSGAWQIDRLAP